MTTRQRLAALAADAGYTHQTLIALARAALPSYQPGQRLDDQQLAQVIEAVDIAAHAGLHDTHIHQLIADLKTRHPGCWQAAFWKHTLTLANTRYASGPEPPARSAA